METGIDKFGTIKDLTKNELHVLGIKDATDMMETGDFDASTLAISARKAVEYLGAFMRKLDSNVIDEIELNNGTINVGGSILELGNTGDRLNYEHDTVFKNLQVQLKARQELLKSATRSDTPITDLNGEIVEPVPIKTAGRSIIKCKI